MAEGSERSGPIDCPSWTVDTPLRILTQRTNGLSGWWQPDTRPRTIPGPVGVMDKRGPVNTSIHGDLRLLAASAFSPISTALTMVLLTQPVIFHLSAPVLPITLNVLVITSTVTVKGEGLI